MTSGPTAEYEEAGSDLRVEAVPLSQVSIEIGHFYAEDLAKGAPFLREHLRTIVRWLTVVRGAWTDMVQRPRISTCLLVDDHSMPIAPPDVLIPMLLDAARDSGLTIDYLARESGCAQALTDVVQGRANGGPDGGVSLAELVESRVVDDPPPNTTAAHPPARQTGWLSNGQRSPAPARTAAMKPPTVWKPPRENAASQHSIFMDVELWKGESPGRSWSGAMLAAVWQLLRLGLLRYHGRAVAVPQPIPDSLPGSWSRLPVVMRVSPEAEPFPAYHTFTICAPRYLATEHAVRTILDRVAVDPAVLNQVRQRSQAEGLNLPQEVVDRVEYLFVGTGSVRGADPG